MNENLEQVEGIVEHGLAEQNNEEVDRAKNPEQQKSKSEKAWLVENGLGSISQ